MKDEIKEINITFPGQILDYVDTKEHLLDLFNYITNLKEEYEKADYDRHKLFEQKERAIEFCKKYDFILKWQLLEILEGEDNTPQENLYKYTPEKGFRLVGDDNE